MPKKTVKAGRGPMIHVRLEEATHKDLKVHVALHETTIQDYVNELIKRSLTRSARNRR